MISNPTIFGHLVESLNTLLAKIGPMPVPIPRAKKNIPNPRAVPTNVISLPARTRNTPAKPPPAIFQDVLAKMMRSKRGSLLILFWPNHISFTELLINEPSLDLSKVCGTERGISIKVAKRNVIESIMNAAFTP